MQVGLLRRMGRAAAWRAQTAAFLQIQEQGLGLEQPREKNVNICLSLHGKWPIIIFFSASLSPTRTKPRSCRLCCLHHFPPLLHLWYANGKTERFCAAEKDLWAYSLGQQLQLLCRGAACCARSLVPRNIPLHVLPKNNNNNNKKELTIWLSRCPETYLKKLWHDILPLVTLWTSKQQATLGSPVQIPAPLCAVQEMMVSSLPQSSSRLSEAEVVQKYFSVYTDALHSWEQK